MKLNVLKIKSSRILWSAIFTMVGLNTFAQAPGGVSANLTLWLKANNAASITGSPVQTWANSGGSATGYSLNQTNATNRPTLVNGATNYKMFNYNPRIDFIRSSNIKIFNTSTSPNLLGSNGTAIVVATQENGNVFTYLSSGRYQLKPTWRFQTGISGTGYTFDWAAPTEYSTDAGTIMCSYGCGTTMELRKNSVLASTPTNVATLYNPSISSGLYLGANNTTEYSDSSVAEVILFNAKPSLAEMHRIETYLSLKYGITRGGNTNTTALYNYIASDAATVIWDKTINTGFNNDIAGIGRDDNSTLNQKQSISCNNNESLTVSLGTTVIPSENTTNTNVFTGNLSFLTWGNNGLSNTFTTTASFPAGISERLNRVWKTQATNFSQQTTFGFENSIITGVGSTSDLCLLFDDDGTDFTNATIVSACSAINVGNKIQFRGITIPAGKPYFTLARMVTPTLITNNGPICEGSTLNLTSETLTPETTYLWTGPNGFTSTNQNPIIPAVTAADSGTYTVLITNQNCTTELNTTVTITASTTPTFASTTPICNGDALTPLPTTSNEGITGIWSPALDNTATTLYTFTPDVGQCATTQTMTITVTPIVNPTFTQVAPICSGDTVTALPTTSIEGITGIWSPTLDNTATTLYTFTPDAGQCATTQTMTITVNPIVNPTFTQVAPICSGDTVTALPTTSIEGITGIWSPTLDNTATTLYTFTPDAGQCATTQTMTITVNPIVNPTFTQVAPICSGDTITALPTTSIEGITGIWSPALDNTATTLYTFTPDVGQCATTQTMTITVTPIVNPTFTQVAPICSGDTVTALPTTSIEGVTGVWSPALDNTATTLYTFTPDVGQCATTQTMTITVNPIVNPTFTQVAPICSGDTVTALPTTSIEGITGIWSPTLDNTATTLYTFTPDAGQCATTQTMTITVNPTITPTFNFATVYCSGVTSSPLPTTSLEGVTGTWSPAFNNTTTTTYTFTPSAGQCAVSPAPVTIQIIQSPVFTITNVSPALCNGESINVTFSSNVPGTTYTWSATTSNINGSYPSSGDETNINQAVQLIDPMVAGSITFDILPTANGCNGEVKRIEVIVNPIPVITPPTVDDTEICTGEMVTIDVNGTPAGIVYHWQVINATNAQVAGGVTSGTSTTGEIEVVLEATTNTTSGTIQFEITPVRNGCTGQPETTPVITVHPTPGTPIPTTVFEICTGGSTNIRVNVLPLIAGTNIEWEVVNVSNVTGATPGSGPITDPIVQQLTNNSTVVGTVTYRVKTELNGCYSGTTDYIVEVHPLPNVTLPERSVICIGEDGEAFTSVLLDTGLSEDDYAFDWTLNGTPIVGGSSILVDQVSELGEYSVIVTSTDPNNPSCPSEPVTSIVEGHTVGTISALIPSVAFDENGSITVVMAGGTGGYLYALSPTGPWQESNVFTNLNTGNSYTVYVTDENGCTSDSQSIYLIGYPHFFTPNGDGANDYWNIWDLEEQPTAEIHIFDRYGKLIKQITPAGGGWDGTMNGQLLPSTDYWFTVKFIDPTNNAERVFKAHFSMKR